MFVVMGATGHVGSAVAESLMSQGQTVTIVTRDAAHARDLQARGARVAVADIEDVDALRAAFRRGRRAFLINPPADVRGDTDAIELHTVSNILAALADSGLEKVVAQSTAGAMPGKGIGDSSVLWELEQGLSRQPVPAAINRAGFYMSNWDNQLEKIRKSGEVQTMYPRDFALPMVAPSDAGMLAAERLLSSLEDVSIRYVEGPARYTSADVAEAFAVALNRPVEVSVTDPSRFRDAYRELGFSAAAAEAYSRMAEETLRSDFDFEDQAVRGSTTLRSYIRKRVERAKSATGAANVSAAEVRTQTRQANRHTNR
ncbi:MAG: NmrA family NAD(P)-binding protein [Proteobacteria bacterium]|nr:NmrA family NAD(P)-binding protein [Pseudomonadota bacterium]